MPLHDKMDYPTLRINSKLKENKIDINRKVLADMAMNDSDKFSNLIKDLKINLPLHLTYMIHFQTLGQDLLFYPN